MPRSTARPPLRLLATVLLSLPLVTGCSDDDPAPRTYLPQTSEDSVLDNLVLAYNERNIEAYSRLLAGDYQLYMDPATRQQLGIEFWTRTTDIAQVDRLFKAARVPKVTLEMIWNHGSASDPNLLPPRDGWTRLDITDMLLDVPFDCPNGESTLFRVDDQRQQFSFRRGYTYPPSGPADTLVYIVQWNDIGTSARMTAAVPSVERTTWSEIRAMEYRCE